MKIRGKCNKIVSGFLTVEAAIVLPIFIYIIVAFLYFLEIISLHEKLQYAITETGFYSAKYAYIYDYIRNYNSDIGIFEEDNKSINKDSSINNNNNGETYTNTIESGIDSIIAKSIDSAFYKLKIQDYINVNDINNSCIKDGYAGIHTYLSSYMNEEDAIDIIIVYYIKLPILFIQLDDIPIIQRIRLRGWSGHHVDVKSNTKSKDVKPGEDIVYITETGTVYHLSKNCTHLSLSVKEVNYNQIKGLRNDSGGKYKKCLLCGNKHGSGGQDAVYITNSGNRYHYDLNCSGLKRTIIEIPISEIGNRSLCNRCKENKQ